MFSGFAFVTDAGYPLSFDSSFHNAYETRNSECTREIKKINCTDTVRLCHNATEYYGFVINPPTYAVSVKATLNITERTHEIYTNLGETGRSGIFGTLDISLDNDDIEFDSTLNKYLLMADAEYPGHEGMIEYRR